MISKLKWLVIFILGFGSLLSGSIYELPQHSIYVNKQEIVLQMPLILKDQVSYVSISDWVTFFSGKFSYSRRNDRYSGVMTSPEKLNFELSPNDKEIVLNGQPKVLTQATLNYRNRMYVPIHSFFTALGYDIDIDDKKIFLKKELKGWVIPKPVLKEKGVKEKVSKEKEVKDISSKDKVEKEKTTSKNSVVSVPSKKESVIKEAAAIDSAKPMPLSPPKRPTSSAGVQTVAKPSLERSQVGELSGQTTISLHTFKKGSAEPKPKLPRKAEVTDFHIAFGLNSYALNDKILFKGRLYVQFEEVLPKEGFKLTPSSTGLTLQYRETSAVFTLNSNVVSIKNKRGTKTASFKNALIRENSKYYVSLESFLEAFQFGFFWDSSKQTLQLLNKLQHLQLSAEEGGYALNIFASSPLMTADPIASNLRRGFYLDIPFSQIDEPETVQFPIETPIANVSLQQKDDTTVRISLFFRKTIGYFPLETIPQGGEIRFYTSMVSLTEKSKEGHQVVTIKANGPFKYTHWFDQVKKKLVIDIPETVTQLPMYIRSDTPDYSEIRTSQLTLHPPQTRLVFELKKGELPLISHIDDETLIVSFGSAPKEEPKPDPVRELVLEPATKPSQKLPPTNEASQEEIVEIQSRGKTEEDTHIIAEEESFFKEEKLPKKRYKPTKQRALRGKVIVVDAGHGGSDPGAVVYRRDYEKNYTLDIAKRLAIALEEDGAHVILTRKSDRTVSLKSRSFIANKNKADLMISVHINSFRKPHIHGTETYYFKYGDKRIATLLQEEMAESLELKDNGIKRSRMFVLRNTKMPAALVEPLFITNEREYKLLKSPEYRQKIADALHRGTVSFFQSK